MAKHRLRVKTLENCGSERKASLNAYESSNLQCHDHVDEDSTDRIPKLDRPVQAEAALSLIPDPAWTSPHGQGVTYGSDQGGVLEHRMTNVSRRRSSCAKRPGKESLCPPSVPERELARA